MPRYTNKQGQYLTYVYYYSKLHGRPPAESEMQRYFRVSPASEHQMVLLLERNQLIARDPGAPRSIRLNLTRPELIELLSSLLLEAKDGSLSEA